MDRELCVLVYSEFSPASKRLIEYIQSLPYDLAAITGMSMFAADTQESRDRLQTLSITTVPCIFVKYFDGRTVIYTDNNVYAFINAISSAMTTSATNNSASNLETNLETNLESNLEIPETNNESPKILKRGDVMSAAKAMQKGREAKEKEESRPPILSPMISTKPPQTKSKKTLLV